MKVSNGGSTLPKVPASQTPGPGHGGNKQPLTGASVYKSASSNFMVGASSNRGKGYK